MGINGNQWFLHEQSMRNPRPSIPSNGLQRRARRVDGRVDSIGKTLPTRLAPTKHRFFIVSCRGQIHGAVIINYEILLKYLELGSLFTRHACREAGEVTKNNLNWTTNLRGFFFLVYIFDHHCSIFLTSTLFHCFLWSDTYPLVFQTDLLIKRSLFGS